MHPAFSVIAFTTLSGAGYGLCIWLAGVLLVDPSAALRLPLSGGLLLALLLVSVGLLSSMAHLGQPQRAWRAFSQWRSSWLSREGVLAVLTYLPLVGLLAAAASWWTPHGALRFLLPAALLLGALSTVVCTAMIYASLKPVPAWRDPLVVPVYLLAALLTGGLLLSALAVLAAPAGDSISRAVLLLLAGTALAVLKVVYWRRIDRLALPRVAAAVGLPASAAVRSWETPHTEASYLTREMGFVLARRHRRRLRVIALLLFAALPVALLGAAMLSRSGLALLYPVAALAALLGTFVERWLFFAEARHVVSVYYG